MHPKELQFLWLRTLWVAPEILLVTAHPLDVEDKSSFRELIGINKQHLRRFLYLYRAPDTKCTAGEGWMLGQELKPCPSQE